MWQKSSFKIKTSMERASCYFIPPALCISSLDLGCSFNSKISRCHFIFETLCTLHLQTLIFRNHSFGNGWKHMNTSFDHDSPILSWNFGRSPRCIATRWHDRFQEIFFSDIVDNCNFGRRNITNDFICLMLWLKCAMSFFLFALGQEWIHFHLYLHLYFFYLFISFLILTMMGVSKLEQLQEQDQPSGALTVRSKYSKYVFVYCCQS